MAFLAHRAASSEVMAGARRQTSSVASSSSCSSARRAASLVARAGTSHKVTVLPGDGIGPEITDVALRVLELAGKKEGHSFQFTTELIGGAAIDATGSPLPDKTLETCKAGDSVLLAAIGG